MKYTFFFLCLLIACIVAKCDQYATKETCLDNCWCAWRSGSWQHPDACISFSSADECDYDHGVVCVDNESSVCYLGDTLILLTKVGLFLIVLGVSLILLLGVICIIVFVVGSICHIVQEELKRRELEHWITYVKIVAGVLIGIVMLCVVLTGVFHIIEIVLTWTFHMIKMLYESTF